MATLTDNVAIVHRITNDGFSENVDYLTSKHDNLFQSFFSTIEDDLQTHKKYIHVDPIARTFFYQISAL